MTRALAAAALIAGVLSIAGTANPPVRRMRTTDVRPVLLRPEVATTIFKAMLPALIDVYWLRTINAVGENDTAEKNRFLYDYARLITELDPKFRLVYWFVAISVPYYVDRDVWVNTDLSNDLLRRGLVQFPDDLKMNLLLGYNLMSYDKNYVEAAKVFSHAATLPGAPPFAGLLATRLYAQGGTPETALELAKQMRDGATDEHSREEFDVRVRELEVEAVLQQVDAAIHRFEADRGRTPESFEELCESGYWTGPKTDPYGGKINIGYDKRSHARSQPRRIEIYESEPRPL